MSRPKRRDSDSSDRSSDDERRPGKRARPGPSRPSRSKFEDDLETLGDYLLKRELDETREVNVKLEDQYLKRWQARQIAKGYVDNTINRVLDSWLATPSPPEENDEIENRGILMAISAHGLQNDCDCTRPPPSTHPPVPFHRRNRPPDEDHCDFIDAAVSFAIRTKGLIPF